MAGWRLVPHRARGFCGGTSRSYCVETGRLRLQAISAARSAILIVSCGVVEPRGRRVGLQENWAKPRVQHSISWGGGASSRGHGGLYAQALAGWAGGLINFHQHEDQLRRLMTCDGRGSERRRHGGRRQESERVEVEPDAAWSAEQRKGEEAVALVQQARVQSARSAQQRTCKTRR